VPVHTDMKQQQHCRFTLVACNDVVACPQHSYEDQPSSATCAQYKPCQACCDVCNRCRA
jgi:hypothetical protein